MAAPLGRCGKNRMHLWMESLQQGRRFRHGARLRPTLGLPLLDACKRDVVHQATATYGIANEQPTGPCKYFGPGAQWHAIESRERHESAPGNEAAEAGRGRTEDLRAHQRLQTIGRDHRRRDEVVVIRCGVFEHESRRRVRRVIDLERGQPTIGAHTVG